LLGRDIPPSILEQDRPARSGSNSRFFPTKNRSCFMWAISSRIAESTQGLIEDWWSINDGALRRGYALLNGKSGIAIWEFFLSLAGRHEGVSKGRQAGEMQAGNFFDDDRQRLEYGLALRRIGVTITGSVNVHGIDSWHIVSWPLTARPRWRHKTSAKEKAYLRTRD